ncbi:MAG: winged helix-turn-helix domain-containing protein [Bacteroidales bacterium]|nr:winged helix-turn-helix domain-containing protein [Bacteroidales bacterium]
MSILSEIFGDCPQAKIIEAFAEHHEDKLYVADIVRMTGVSKSTVYKHLRKLIAEGVIEEKGSAGNIKFYQLNPSSPKAKIIMKLESFFVSESLEAPINAGLGEGGQKSTEAAHGDEKTRQLVPKESEGAREETSAVEEEKWYIDSYGIEAASTADGETYLIGNFESFEDAKDFLKSELNHFETVNARIIRHTERTSMEAIFTDRIEDFFYHKPPSWDSQI